ncbi:DUF3592 domain-containing protein [Arcticibacterium luteifluviistationis]|uniref:DUF3592 domain-containing protein n=1 Tax=Arcticibacterium luteifluviistationis TaxID=1784714 RepID=A0A2Z4G8I1_9BACT|nr:DUF3592 domain-containing protein [Arcticibacterium luteifluviistationis]AWV97454.1 hypothetical protein DJ013_04420 [Arcticibacterium luteifluviistationis]
MEKPAEMASPAFIFGVGVVLICVGLGFGYYKFEKSSTASHLKENGVSVKSVITDFSQGGKSPDNSYHYTLEYQWEGKTFEYEASFKFREYKLGEEVEILVNPEEPEEAIINSHSDMDKGSYTWALILIGLGVFIFKLGFKRIAQLKME